MGIQTMCCYGIVKGQMSENHKTKETDSLSVTIVNIHVVSVHQTFPGDLPSLEKLCYTMHHHHGFLLNRGHDWPLLTMFFEGVDV